MLSRTKCSRARSTLAPGRPVTYLGDHQSSSSGCPAPLSTRFVLPPSLPSVSSVVEPRCTCAAPHSSCCARLVDSRRRRSVAARGGSTMKLIDGSWRIYARATESALVDRGRHRLRGDPAPGGEERIYKGQRPTSRTILPIVYPSLSLFRRRSICLPVQFTSLRRHSRRDLTRSCSPRLALSEFTLLHHVSFYGGKMLLLGDDPLQAQKNS